MPESQMRTQRVTTALTETELAQFDEDRGILDRSTFLRYLIQKAHKEQVRFENV